ncbi:MAG: cation transporter [Rhodobiaceae bacterium]|jgi:cobalt-zinc-cadmium efflux system protein|nr:cation transporter [Rhodobiaceae bacterium]
MENTPQGSAAANIGHGHAGHLPSGGRALTISAWLTGLYFIAELIVGLWTGSIAVLSDAFHTFSAVGGVLVAIAAARIARRPADMRRTFGWYRAEIIGALVNGAFLLIMALVVIVMGAMRLGAPIDLPTTPMLLVAAGGIVTELIALFLLYQQQGKDMNVRGAYWHIIQTFVGSLTIIVAAVVIHFTGFLAIDPLLGIAFGFVLLWASWGIMRDATHLLMDGTPDDVSLPDIIASLSALNGVVDVHHVHGWALTSGRYVFSAHLRIDPTARQNQPALLQQAHGLLRDDWGFFFATLQIETECLDEQAATDIDITRDPVRSGAGHGEH